MNIVDKDYKVLYGVAEDKLDRLNVDKLYLCTEAKISNKMIKIFSRIKHNTFYFCKINPTFNDIKGCLSLNSINLEIAFKRYNNSRFILTFINSPIMLFNYSSNEKLYYVCQSIKLKLYDEEFKKLVLLKRKSDDYKSSAYLHIPLDMFKVLVLSKFKTTIDSQELDKQFKYFKDQGLIVNSGFIIPLKQLDQAYFYGGFLDKVKENKDVSSEVFKTRRVDLQITTLDELLEIKQLAPENVSHFYYSLESYKKDVYINVDKETINDLISIKPKFTEILINKQESSELILKLLHSRKSRSNLTSVTLKFNLLSEWIEVLSLFVDCQELQFISLSYLKSDVENEKQAIESAVTDFRKKFEFIDVLEINYES